MAPADEEPELTPEEVRLLKEQAQRLKGGRVNRRDVLAGGAGMAVGAAGLAGLTGGGSAQPTGDEGSVGTQSNRFEAWISEADANEVHADQINNTQRITSDISRITGGSISSNTRYIIEGDHTVSSQIDISGVSHVELIISDASTLTASGLNRFLRVYDTADHIHIQGGEFDGAQTEANQNLFIDGQYVTVQGVHSHDANHANAYFEGNARHSRYIDCHFKDTHGSTNASVTNNGVDCHYLGCTIEETVTAHHVANLFEARDCSYAHCTFNGGNTATNGVWLEDQNIARDNENNTIIGCTIKDLAADGIRTDGADIGTEVIGCTVRNTDRGVRILGSEGLVVGTTVENPGSQAFESTSDTKFIGCVATDGSSQGFDITGSAKASGCLADGCSGNGFLIDSASNVVVEACVATNNTVDGFSVRNTASDTVIDNCEASGNGSQIRVRSGPTDTRIVNPLGTVVDAGTRTTQDGLGTNAGDPSSSGDWNGNGREGVIVRDTTNSNTYIYNNGSWSQIASA